MSNEIELKACPNPRCGSASVDLMTVTMGEYHWTVGCNECAMTGPQTFTNHQARDQWNALPRAQQPAQTAGLRERIRDAIAADELVSVHAASDIKDQYCYVTELALDHIADIAAQAVCRVDGVAAVKEAWAALQVAVLDGRGWADKIVPMQKAIDALAPPQGSDTQRLDVLITIGDGDKPAVMAQASPGIGVSLLDRRIRRRSYFDTETERCIEMGFSERIATIPKEVKSLPIAEIKEY